MPYHNPNSRSRRNTIRIVGVLVVLAVIAGVANFLHATTSEAAGNVKPQIETMQGIRQTAQDSITFAQGLDDPDRFAAHIETVQQCMDDYDRLADAKQIKYLLSDNLQERIIGLLYRNQQRTIIDSMRVAAHNLDGQTKELLSAVDAAMADDFSQHAAHTPIRSRYTFTRKRSRSPMAKEISSSRSSLKRSISNSLVMTFTASYV